MVTIVGVVEDVKNRLITDHATPFIYLPLEHRYQPRVNVLTRFENEKIVSAASLVSAISALALWSQLRIYVARLGLYPDASEAFRNPLDHPQRSKRLYMGKAHCPDDYFSNLLNERTPRVAP